MEILILAWLVGQVVVQDVNVYIIGIGITGTLILHGNVLNGGGSVCPGHAQVVLTANATRNRITI